MTIVLTCAALIALAALGEYFLAFSGRARRWMGLLGALVLAACLADEGGPISCSDCHRDCGVLRSECHAHCDEMHCRDGEQHAGAGGAGEER